MAAVANPYDEFAAQYAASNESNVWNAHYERPASLALVGPVGGLDVLDVGCGAGAASAELVAMGARLTGLDSSPRMLELARNRLGPDVELHVHDVQDPLPFPAASFDVVLASLVLHYVEDWHAVLAELRRVTRRGGRLVVSTHHPFMDHALSDEHDYFATYEIVENWTKDDRTVTVRFWHRPLHAMVDAFQETGWTIKTIAEPRPDPSVALLYPEEYRLLTTGPRFLFFALQAS